MLKDKKMYLLAIFLLGFGIANLFRNLDFVHHIINLVGLALITYSLIFSQMGANSKNRWIPMSSYLGTELVVSIEE